MTTTINLIITEFLKSTGYGALTNGIAILSIALLLFLLIERVLIEAYDNKTHADRIRVFNISVWPFAFILAVSVVVRAAQILHLW